MPLCDIFVSPPDRTTSDDHTVNIAGTKPRTTALFVHAQWLWGSSSSVTFFRNTCNFSRDEEQVQITNPTGRFESIICAPKCDPQSEYSCNSYSSSEDSAKPVCTIRQAQIDAGSTGGENYYCALPCVSDGHCPAGGRCRMLVQGGYGEAYKGICITPANVDSSKPTISAVMDFPPTDKRNLLSIWQTLDANSGPQDSNPAVQAVQARRKEFATEADYQLALDSVRQAVGGAAGSTSSDSPPRQKTQDSIMNPGSLKGDMFGDVVHDAKYVGKHILDGDFIRKEAHDTYWNLTHLHTGAYAILHGMFTLFMIYCFVGSCLNYHVAKRRGLKMLPHIEFWLNYPELVIEGMHVTKNVFTMEVWSRVNDKLFGNRLGQDGAFRHEEGLGYSPIGFSATNQTDFSNLNAVL